MTDCAVKSVTPACHYRNLANLAGKRVSLWRRGVRGEGASRASPLLVRPWPPGPTILVALQDLLLAFEHHSSQRLSDCCSVTCHMSCLVAPHLPRRLSSFALHEIWDRPGRMQLCDCPSQRPGPPRTSARYSASCEQCNAQAFIFPHHPRTLARGGSGPGKTLPLGGLGPWLLAAGCWLRLAASGCVRMVHWRATTANPDQPRRASRLEGGPPQNVPNFELRLGPHRNIDMASICPDTDTARQGPPITGMSPSTSAPSTPSSCSFPIAPHQRLLTDHRPQKHGGIIIFPI
jgi:hypothetical protein